MRVIGREEDQKREVLSLFEGKPVRKVLVLRNLKESHESNRPIQEDTRGGG